MKPFFKITLISLTNVSGTDFELLVEMTDQFGFFAAAKYGRFSVGSKNDGFPLFIGDYAAVDGTPEAGDALSVADGVKMSAVDVDNDGSAKNCSNYLGDVPGW